MIRKYLTKEIVRYPMVCSWQFETFYLTADVVESIINLYETIVHLST